MHERLADIVPLAEHFLRKASKPPKRLTPEAATCLLAHPWPGNVRELRNAIERAIVLSRNDVIGACDLGFLGEHSCLSDIGTGTWTDGDLPTAVARLEAHMIVRVLRECGGNRTEAARRLGINRQLLYTKVGEIWARSHAYIRGS